MNDPQHQGPDWNAVFDAAHRRIAGRLLLLAGLAAAGALLLLGSGLTANGTIVWKAAPTKSKAKKEPPKKTPPKKKPPQNRPPIPPPENTPPPKRGGDGKDRDPDKRNPGGKEKPKCGTDSTYSAATQYEDCPPDVDGNGNEDGDKVKLEGEETAS